MKFGSTSVGDATGCILAHTTQIDGKTLKKGHILAQEDCQALADSGVNQITVARLETGDVHEDAAARAVASVLSGSQVTLSEAHTGRCNLTATADGLVDVNSDLINALNAIDESVTVASLPHFEKTALNQVIATVKIIPFAVSSETMDRIMQVALHESAAISVSPFTQRRSVIINTVTRALKASVLEKTTELTKRRLSSINFTVEHVITVEHTELAVEAALKEAVELSPDLIVIVGASVTVDRADTVPSGIALAGGTVRHFGMPVDPGNLMVLAELQAVPVLVLPGCARSPKLNGIDWVLQRLAAGLKVGPSDIMGMGVGGLLVDSPVRPLPREDAVRPEQGTQHPPHVAAVVLAAGQSRRMGGSNKLLESVEGVPLIRRTVSEATRSKADPIVVVLGHQADQVREALDGLTYEAVHNHDYTEGLSASLKAGISALPSNVEGAVVCLGDMPSVSGTHLDALIDAFNPEEGRAIGVPVHKGKRGNPVLWARRFFAVMGDVHGDVGARHLIGDHEDLVYEVEFGDTAVLTDLDTPEAWARYRGEQTS